MSVICQAGLVKNCRQKKLTAGEERDEGGEGSTVLGGVRGNTMNLNSTMNF